MLRRGLERESHGNVAVLRLSWGGINVEILVRRSGFDGLDGEKIGEVDSKAAKAFSLPKKEPQTNRNRCAKNLKGLALAIVRLKPLGRMPV